MKKSYLIEILLVVIVSFFGCKEKELEQIISKVDGEQYYSDMAGEMSARKATRLIIEDKVDQVPETFQVAISDSLCSADSSWRKLHFEAFSRVVVNFNDQQKEEASPGVFIFLMHYPQLFIEQVSALSLEKSDCFLELIAMEVNRHTENQQITENSIINLAIEHCQDCSQKNKDFLVQYIRLADKLIIE